MSTREKRGKGKWRGCVVSYGIGAWQIIGGEIECCYCDKQATMFVNTGADPDPEPTCWQHGIAFLEGTVSLFKQWAGA